MATLPVGVSPKWLGSIEHVWNAEFSGRPATKREFCSQEESRQAGGNPKLQKGLTADSAMAESEDELDPALEHENTRSASLQLSLLVSKGHEVREEQRIITQNLERHLVNCTNEADGYDGQIRSLTGSVGDDALVLRRTRRDLHQAQMMAAYHKTALEVARARPHCGKTRLAELQLDGTENSDTFFRDGGTTTD